MQEIIYLQKFSNPNLQRTINYLYMKIQNQHINITFLPGCLNYIGSGDKSTFSFLKIKMCHISSKLVNHRLTERSQFYRS